MKTTPLAALLTVLATGPAAFAQPAGTAFTYQGRLTDAGTPVTGPFDLQCVLYTAAIGGSPVGSPVLVGDVAVANGLFTVTLDFGAAAFDGNARYLEIGVRPGASTGAYTLLGARQELKPAPQTVYAQTTPWTGIAGKPAGFADNIDNDSGGDITGVTAGTGLIGGGTAGGVVLSADYATIAANHTHFGQLWTGGVADGLRVVNTGDTGVSSQGARVGVEGTTTSTGGAGVYGASTASTGVLGETSATTGSGVQGLSTHSSGTAPGVQGRTVSPNGVGVDGAATAATGLAVGVRGQTASSSGRAVSGLALAASGLAIGVYGETSSSAGTGVMGIASAGATGSANGVRGATSSSLGIGVLGEHTSTNGQGSAVRGITSSQQGIGVSGLAESTVGGTGVQGIASSSIGTGVEARHNSNVGTGTGLTATTGSQNGAAVFAINQAGTAFPAGRFQGRVDIIGTLSKSSGSFRIDHPLDPDNKYLYHSFVESPDMMNVYNGNAVTDGEGYATVALPDWFEALNRDFRYQLTVLDEADSAAFVQVKLVRRIADNRFTIRTSGPRVEVSWQVTGVRKDAYAEKHRVPVEEMKADVDRGTRLHPEDFGLPPERGATFGIPRERLAPAGAPDR